MCNIRLLLLINMRVPCEGDSNLSEVKDVELRDMNIVFSVTHILTIFQWTVKGKEIVEKLITIPFDIYVLSNITWGISGTLIR